MVYVGYLLILAAGTGVGMCASHRLQQRVTFLALTGRVLQTLQQQVGYTTLPMSALWQRLARVPVLCDFSLLRDIAQELKQADFATAFAVAVERASTAGLLTPAGRQLLLEFGEGCGRYDVTRQEEHIAHYRALLKEQECLLQQEADSKGRVYRVMGMAGGGALALLLL